MLWTDGYLSHALVGCVRKPPARLLRATESSDVTDGQWERRLASSLPPIVVHHDGSLPFGGATARAGVQPARWWWAWVWAGRGRPCPSLGRGGRAAASASAARSQEQNEPTSPPGRALSGRLAEDREHRRANPGPLDEPHPRIGGEFRPVRRFAVSHETVRAAVCRSDSEAARGSTVVVPWHLARHGQRKVVPVRGRSRRSTTGRAAVLPESPRLRRRHRQTEGIGRYS